EPLAAVRRCGPGVQQLFGDLPEHAEDRLCTGDHQGDVQPLRCGGDGRGQAGEGTLEPLAQLPWTGRLAAVDTGCGRIVRPRTGVLVQGGAHLGRDLLVGEVRGDPTQV